MDPEKFLAIKNSTHCALPLEVTLWAFLHYLYPSGPDGPIGQIGLPSIILFNSVPTLIKGVGQGARTVQDFGPREPGASCGSYKQDGRCG